LGVGPGLKDCASCLGNWKGYFVTLFSAKQQKITQKEKKVNIFNQHFKLKKSSLALWDCLLFIGPKKTEQQQPNSSINSTTNK
jgi:hypothetical protein